MAEYLLGIDLGGTNIKMGCFDTDLNLIGKISVPTGKDNSPQAIVENFYATAQELAKQIDISYDDIAAVGIGAPGVIDSSKGIIYAAPNLPFKDVPMAEMVTKRLGKAAIVENDANVACWGEYANGAAKGIDHMVMLTLGTGVGGGIISDGKLITGPAGGAGELGHMIVYPEGRPCNCGQNGCVESHASANATAARATEEVQRTQAGKESSLAKVLEDNGRISCKDVFDHAKAGDMLAMDIVDGTAKALALICTQLANATDPETIVFAGGMIAAGDALMDRIRFFYKKYIGALYQKGKLKLCFATLGEDAGIIGAAALALKAAKS